MAALRGFEGIGRWHRRRRRAAVPRSNLGVEELLVGVDVDSKTIPVLRCRCHSAVTCAHIASDTLIVAYLLIGNDFQSGDPPTRNFLRRRR